METTFYWVVWYYNWWVGVGCYFWGYMKCNLSRLWFYKRNVLFCNEILEQFTNSFVDWFSGLMIFVGLLDNLAVWRTFTCHGTIILGKQIWQLLYTRHQNIWKNKRKLVYLCFLYISNEIHVNLFSGGSLDLTVIKEYGRDLQVLRVLSFEETKQLQEIRD